VIDPAEFQRLRKLSDDFVSIRRVVVQGEREQEREEARTELAELQPDQLFRRFFERRRGAQPDERLVDLFLRLLAEESGEEETG
jgi:exonuclease SbcD